MARGVNKVILIGNLGADPEVKYMPNGNAVANVTIATSESWKDKQTGELHNMLIKISDTFDDEVDAMVSGLMGMLEPLLIVGLGGVVGFIVIALFLPLIKLLQKVGER